MSPHVLLVASGELRLPNIVDNNVKNFFTAVFLEIAFRVHGTVDRACTGANPNATEQTKALAELAQKIALAGAKPLQEGVARAFNRAA